MRKKEKLARHAAEVQRSKGQIPETRAIDEEFSRRLERIDRRKAESGGGISKAKPDGGARRKTAADLLAKRGAELLPSGETRKREAKREASRKRKNPYVTRRIRLLSRYPEWRRRVIDAWDEGAREALRVNLMPQSKRARELSASLVERVMDESSAIFGDWRKPSPTRSTFSGSGESSVGKSVITP